MIIVIFFFLKIWITNLVKHFIDADEGIIERLHNLLANPRSKMVDSFHPHYLNFGSFGRLNMSCANTAAANRTCSPFPWARSPP